MTASTKTTAMTISQYIVNLFSIVGAHKTSELSTRAEALYEWAGITVKGDNKYVL